MPDLLHLHNHTQYSLLDGASNIKELMDKAVRDGMKGLALTDHGNMFRACRFLSMRPGSGISNLSSVANFIW